MVAQEAAAESGPIVDGLLDFVVHKVEPEDHVWHPRVAGKKQGKKDL